MLAQEDETRPRTLPSVLSLLLWRAGARLINEIAPARSLRELVGGHEGRFTLLDGGQIATSEHPSTGLI